MQHPRQNGIERAIREGRIHQEQPAILRHQSLRQRGQVFFFRLLARLFQRQQNVFERREVRTRHGKPGQMLGQCRKQSGRFGLPFFAQGSQDPLAQFFRQLIRPEPLGERLQLRKTRGHLMPHCRAFVFQAARVVQQDQARLPARGVGSRVR